MNRQISYVTLDALDNVTSRYTPDFVTDLSGFGASRTIHEVETETRRLMTRIDPLMPDMTFINWFNSDGDHAYLRSRAFKAWELETLAKKKTFAVEYNDGQELNYCVGTMQAVALGERSEGRRLGRAMTFHPATPWLKLTRQSAEINMPSFGKRYPLRYPYRYGAKYLTNNIVENKFYKTVPLKIIIFGLIKSPIRLTLHHWDKENNRDLGIYSKIQINGLTIPASDSRKILKDNAPEIPDMATPERTSKVLMEREHLFLDGDSKQILYWNGREYEDKFSLRDPRFDSYFQLEPGTSLISMAFNTGDTGSLITTRRQATEL